MALNNHDQAQIRQYLLGTLSESEQEKIEERLMVEDELFDEFEASKDELVEEYRAGHLARTEREWLESHYLASAEGRQRHAFALTLDHLRQQQCDPVPAPAPLRTPNFFERLWQFATARPWALATASLVVVILFGFIAFRLISQSQAQVFEATLISAPATRGGEAPPLTRIELPANTTQLKVHLQLPKPAPANTRYTAVLDDRLNRNNVDVVAFESDSVTVSIPRKQLPRGWYTLELTATNPDGNGQQLLYPFDVE